MAMATSTGSADHLDGLLERLAGILRSSTGDGDGGTAVVGPSEPPPPPADVTTGSESLPPPTAGEQLHKFRSDLATELAYLMAIPPLTDDLQREIDEGFEKFFQMIKVAPYRPYVLSLLDQMFGRTAAGGNGQAAELPTALAAHALGPLLSERSTEDDPELEHIAKRMAQDILGGDERAIPVALAIFYAVGGAAGGATLGYHVGKIIKKL